MNPHRLAGCAVHLRRVVLLVAVAFMLLPSGEAAAQFSGFVESVTAVGGSATPNDPTSVTAYTGRLTDGSSFSYVLSTDFVTFTGGSFTGMTTFTVTSASLVGNVASFKGFRTIDAGPPVAFDCTIDLSTSATSGNCGGFLGIGGVASTQSAINASTQGQLRSGSTAVGALIGERVRDIMRGVSRRAEGSAPQSGLAAGSAPARYGVWADASGARVDNDAPGKAYRGWSTTALSGLDALIGKEVLLGFSVGWVNADLDLVSLAGTRHSRGAIAGPYAAWIISGHWTLDANATFGRIYNDLAIGTTPVLRNHVSSNRWAGAANLSWLGETGPLSLTGIAGTAVAWEHQQSYSDDSGNQFPTLNARFAALKLGGEIAWPLGDAEPYMPIGYEYQLTTPRDGTNRMSILLGLGLRYRLGDNLKAGLLATTEELRTNERTTTVGANLRYSF